VCEMPVGAQLQSQILKSPKHGVGSETPEVLAETDMQHRLSEF
jgi:hypothetical protein